MARSLRIVASSEIDRCSMTERITVSKQAELRYAILASDDRMRDEHLELAAIYQARADLLSGYGGLETASTAQPLNHSRQLL